MVLQPNDNFAFLFPGQGSQSIGMLCDIASKYSIVEQTFSEASDLLKYDLWELVQNGPAEKLNQTQFTQPALLTAEVALWRIVSKIRGDIKPQFLAGHSLGEYSALVCAEVLEFVDALNLVIIRAELMQQSVPSGQGAMAAVIGLEEQQINEICLQAAQNEIISPANYNSIGQVVLAGQTNAVNRAVDLAKKMGAKMAKTLAVSIPSHCLLMRPAALQFKNIIAKVKLDKPVISVVNNVDVACCIDADLIRDALVRQLYSPIRWVETIQFISKNNINNFFECGPGRVLTGLTRRIISQANNINYNELLGVENVISK